MSKLIRHVAGIVAAGLLIAACQVVWQTMPQILDGTPFAEFRILATLAAAFAVMSAGHALWDLINRIAMRRHSSASTDSDASSK